MHHRNTLLAAFCAVLSACSDSDGGGTPPSLQFGAPERYPFGDALGRDLAFADLDADAVDDAVVALAGSNQFVWLPGQRPSGFASPLASAAVDRPNVLAVGDFSGDRIPDVVTGSSIDPRVGISRNLGAGSFTALTLYALPTPTRDLQITDATGDGRADIVSASATVNELHILPGDGRGGFGVPITLPLSTLPGNLVVADFDGNGTRDLATAAAGGSVVLVLPWVATGGFGPAVETRTDALAGKLAAGDLDRDGVLDLVVMSLSGSVVDSLRGNGIGGFARVGSQSPGGVLDSLALADLDGDGWLDLATSTGSDLRICYGLGGGEFGAAEIAVTDTAGVSTVTTRDVNADGRPDLAYITDNDELGILANPQPIQTGLVPYGTGTPDCSGAIVMNGNSRPYLGNLDFAFVVSGAPARRGGLIAIGFGQDEPGSDLFGLGFLFHLLPGPELNPRYLVADANGGAVDPLEIPELPNLVGGTVYAQTVWLGGIGTSCSTSPFGLSSSRGLGVTVQTP